MRRTAIINWALETPTCVPVDIGNKRVYTCDRVSAEEIVRAVNESDSLRDTIDKLGDSLAELRESEEENDELKDEVDTLEGKVERLEEEVKKLKESGKGLSENQKRILVLEDRLMYIEEIADGTILSDTGRSVLDDLWVRKERVEKELQELIKKEGNNG